MSKFVSFSNINQTNKFKSKKNIIKGSYIKKIQFQNYTLKCGNIGSKDNCVLLKDYTIGI